MRDDLRRETQRTGDGFQRGLRLVRSHVSTLCSMRGFTPAVRRAVFGIECVPANTHAGLFSAGRRVVAIALLIF